LIAQRGLAAHSGLQLTEWIGTGTMVLIGQQWTAVALSSIVLVSGQDNSWETDLADTGIDGNTTCAKNNDCRGFAVDWGVAIGVDYRMPADGSEFVGNAAAVRTSAYCAIQNETGLSNTNGQCFPCIFEEQVSPGVWEGRNCYTKHGYFNVVDGSRPSWAALDATLENQAQFVTDRGTLTWGAVTGCEHCDSVIPEEERGGITGTVCDVHEACQKGYYCENLEGTEEEPIGDVCTGGGRPLFSNGVCEEPFTCELGTDKTDCKTQSAVCMECTEEQKTSWSAVYCHESVPSHWKDLLRGTSAPILAIYVTLVGCTILYPIWCTVAMLLKAFCKACSDEKHTFGI